MDFFFALLCFCLSCAHPCRDSRFAPTRIFDLFRKTRCRGYFRKRISTLSKKGSFCILFWCVPPPHPPWFVFCGTSLTDSCLILLPVHGYGVKQVVRCTQCNGYGCVARSPTFSIFFDFFLFSDATGIFLSREKERRYQWRGCKLPVVNATPRIQ